MLEQIKIKKLNHAKNLDLPKYETPGSAGMDLCAAIQREITLEKNQYKLIPTGLIIDLPIGFEAQIRPRSGLALKYGITVLNSPGTIDSDYRGEIGVILINNGKEKFIIKNGMRIAQMIISKFTQVSLIEEKNLTKTERGNKGFGSTGTK
tara:strand:+ start:212 stop:661 length:450 start_codon:yes stop_codon:yes gene_type:complete